MITRLSRFLIVRPTVAGLVVSTFLAMPGLGRQATGQDDETHRRRRLQMVEEYIEQEGINNEAVLRAMREVPRHLFVPPDLRAHAYKDLTLPMAHKQTVSPPYIVAYMTQAIDPQPGDRVLEIGTGSGYQAAVLAKIVKDVYTIEIVEPLGKEAAKRLQDLGYRNVKTKVGDGYLGWPEYAPFDKIIVTCSPENVPQPLVDQLRENGKMIVPIGERYQQMFYLFEKRSGKLVRTKLLPTLFVPMTGAAEGQRKVQYDPAHPRIANGGFEQSTDGRPDVWFYVRQATLEHKGAPQGKNFLAFTNSEEGRDAEARQAIGIDGKRVRSVALSSWVSGEAIKPGGRSFERAAIVIQFFDSENMPISQQVLGPWQGTFGWRRASAELQVPKQATMAILRVGLNGATGILGVDDIRLVAHHRQ
jgi:protein-L-isoaspartate(D-aspartate) O-methyltransferase